MTTTDAFKDRNLVIYVTNTDNKMSIPLENAKGNIGNAINFLMYVFINSGMEWQDIYHELANFVHRKIDDIEFEQNLKPEKELINIFNKNDEC